MGKQTKINILYPDANLTSIRIGFANKTVDGSVSTLCNPPCSQTDKPVEV